MSTLKTNTIQHLTSGFNNIVTHTDGAGTVNAAHCRVWVNFDASSGTPSIRANFNVSSITDNGVGDFTVNFTNALADANYAVTTTPTSTGNAAPVLVIYSSASVPTTSSVRLQAGDQLAVRDFVYNNVAIFR
jgi:hypothetical protein